MRPLVSVIVPSYNHEVFVEQALQSVLAQTYENIELIVIDDGSSDRSVQRIQSVLDSANDAWKSRIKFLHRNSPKGNQGAAATINEGLEISSGNYLTLLNSDDFYQTSRIEKLVQRLLPAGETPALAFSAVHQIGRKGESLIDTDPNRAWYLKCRQSVEKLGSVSLGVCKHNIAMTSGNLFFNRSLLEKIGGFGPYQMVHDYDFLLRSLFFADPMYLDEELLTYRHHARNTYEKSKALMAKEIWLVAHHFFQKIQFESEPENNLAPWHSRQRPAFSQFLKNEQSVLTSILGHVPAIL